MPTRVLIADDHPIILDGLAQRFELRPEFEVVARCTNGNEALAAIRRLRPDVAILDLRMPGRTGLDVLRAVRGESIPTRVVLLTAEITDEETVQAMQLSLNGLVLKEAASAELTHAVEVVAKGGEYVDQRSVRGALERMIRREAGAAEARSVLTARELELVRLAATGLRNRQIAERLSISESTVKIHLHSIYQKLGVSGRVELSNYAREKSLI